MNQGEASVYIVDDDFSVREALKNLLRAVGLKVMTFATAQEFLECRRYEGPSCLVLDVRLPGLSGLDLQERLAEENSGIPIIFITAHGDVQMSVRAMKAGAVEFLTKPFRDQDLLDAVQHAIERDCEAGRLRAQTALLLDRFESLSTREKEVMKLVAQGFLNKQIASRLGTSNATVKMHRGHLMEKMHASSMAELARMAERLHLPAADVARDQVRSAARRF